jgi:hypothetical protein
MNMLKTILGASARARGMSNTAAIVIAVVVVLLGWRLIIGLLTSVAFLLRVAIEVGVLIAAVLALAMLIRYLARKMN